MVRKRRIAKPGKYRVVIYRGRKKMETRTLNWPNQKIVIKKTSKTYRKKHAAKMKSKRYRTI